jgi:hypothetical protein
MFIVYFLLDEWISDCSPTSQLAYQPGTPRPGVAKSGIRTLPKRIGDAARDGTVGYERSSRRCCSSPGRPRRERSVSGRRKVANFGSCAALAFSKRRRNFGATRHRNDIFVTDVGGVSSAIPARCTCFSEARLVLC